MQRKCDPGDSDNYHGLINYSNYNINALLTSLVIFMYLMRTLFHIRVTLGAMYPNF